MNTRFLLLPFLLSLLSPLFISTQSLQDLDSYSVEAIYEVVELAYETLDEDGQAIDRVFIPSEIDSGTYEITISNGPGNLYEINGTDLFFKVRGYLGYAGYRRECILEVESGYYRGEEIV